LEGRFGVDSVLEHVLADSANFNEAAWSGIDGGKDIWGFVDVVESIFVVLASSLEVSLFIFSSGEDHIGVFLVAEGLLLIDFELASCSNLLDLTSGEGRRWVSQNVAGVSDLFVSEIIFWGTLILLSGIDFIVVDLFIIDSISEFFKDIEDSIKWGFTFKFCFYLNHNSHYGSLVSVVEGIFLGQSNSIDCYQHNNNTKDKSHIK